MLSEDQINEHNLYICPRCAANVQTLSGKYFCSNKDCQHSGDPFPTVSGIPVLVDFDSSVLNSHKLIQSGGASELSRKKGCLKRFLMHLSYGRNKIAPVVIAELIGLLTTTHAYCSQKPRVLIVGGGSIGSGLESLYDSAAIDILAFDIYASPHVQFIADGHSIPLRNGAVDAVVVQAVLEHVLEPPQVVREITRVLREGGLVYADTPFMQQVHEGPYDFSRYTDSGHRYLFRDFQLLRSGATAGAGTALRWSIEYFVRALTRSPRIGQIISLGFFWLAQLDPVLSAKHSLDAASGVYFLGRKQANRIAEKDIIEYYSGGY